MVEPQPSKLVMRVRFPSSAPSSKTLSAFVFDDNAIFRAARARSTRDGHHQLKLLVDDAQRSVLTQRRFLVILLTMTVLPLGDVKSHLSELVGRVHDHHERVTVTVHGKPSAILIAPEDLEALEETLEIMRDATTMNRLAESDAELARGEYVSAEELAEAMRRRQAQ
jgi:antitoxin YefM